MLNFDDQTEFPSKEPAKTFPSMSQSTVSYMKNALQKISLIPVLSLESLSMKLP